MNINATLIGQSAAFVVFVWFCMKFVWPPVIKALEERKKKIADGLAFAEQADIKLAHAEKEAEACINNAKKEAENIIKKANDRALDIIDEAKVKAQGEAERIRSVAEKEMERELVKARTALRKQVASLVVAGASQIVGEHVDEAANSKIVDRLVTDL